MATRAQCRLRIIVVLICLVLGGPGAVRAQITPEDHARHHPGGSAVMGAATNAPGMGGMDAMGGMMQEMMKNMGAPTPKQLYPALMGLPDLTPEQRAAVERQAQERMAAGVSLMSQGFDGLHQALMTNQLAAMQDSLGAIREGLAQFDSGLAARRALTEGQAPRDVALQWLKREMNLLPPPGSSASHPLGGVTFHLVALVILGAFAAVMVWMYFFKMRRASALLKSLAGAAAGSVPAPAPASPSTQPIASAASALPEPRAKPANPLPAVTPKFPAMKSRSEPVEKWTGRLRVCRIFQETPDVKTFRLAALDEVARPFTYFPGQFLTLAVNVGGRVVKRSYTIASTPTQLHYCAITVKREENGLVSRFLYDQVKEGDVLEVSAPNGKFIFTGDEARSIALIGGGVGITPLMSVIRYLTDIGWRGDICLLYCSRDASDFIFREELEQLQQRHSNLQVFATVTRAAGTVWMGLKGRFTTAILGHLVPDIAKRRVHVCGPSAMMSAVLDMLRELQVPDDHVLTEAFGAARKPSATPEPVIGETIAPNGELKAALPMIAFKRSGKSGALQPGQTVLDAAEANGVEIDNSCRSGQCGLCKVKLLSGAVTMDCEDALSPDEKRQGFILACQARATANIEVEA